MKGLKERILGSRWFYLLISIVAAVGFWLYVQTTTDPTSTMWYNNVPVNIIGASVLTSQGMTVGSISSEAVNLYIEAPSSVHTDLLRNRSSLAVTVDVSRCTEGENQLAFTPSWPSTVNSDRITLSGREPSNVTVNVEKLYTRSFDIKFELQGRVAEGYQLGTAAISPESVVISGPVEQLSRISQVVAVLSEENLSEQFSGDLPLTLLDSEGNVLTDLEVTLGSESAYVVVPVVVVKEVPLTVNVLPGGGAREENATVDIDPPSITVSGTEAALAGLDSISLGSVDLSRVVGSNTFTFPITLDSSLGNVSGESTANVEVTIHDLATRTLEVSNITAINVPEGFTANLITVRRTITLRGAEEDLEEIDASQVRITVDLSEIDVEGTVSAKAMVYLDATDRVGAIGEYYISVDMTRS